MKEQTWTWEIAARPKWSRSSLSELFAHKDLLFSFVKRELLSGYHQTALGMVWIVLQPLFTTLLYLLVFGTIVRVSTDGIPPVLFYMSGIIFWSFFSDCLSGAMYSFIKNAHIFNKVYFPRLLVPFSMVLNHFVRFAIQFVMFVVLFIFYADMLLINVTALLWLPVLVLITALLGLGIGLIVSTLMIKYRDMEQMMLFAIRLFMFVTPVVYPASLIPDRFKMLYWLNPMTPIIETCRAILFQHANINLQYLLLALVNTTIILIIGLILFKRREISAMDSI